MVTSFNRQSLDNIQTLLSPVTAENPVGENLYYDPLYDQIKEARREDDPTLSQGIWEIELKKADWPQVENLASRALITQTKDLQIAGWLIEAWVAMDHLDGLFKGITLLQHLAETYWDSLYPQIQEGDLERRTHLFEWLDNALANRLVTLPLIDNALNASPICLADWMQANRLETVSKRSSNPQKILQKAAQQQELTLEKIYQILKICPQTLLENLSFICNQTLQIYEDFKKYLDKLFGNELRPAMNQVPETLKELQRLVKAGLYLPPLESEVLPEHPSEPSSPPLETLPPAGPSLQAPTSLSNRSQAYKTIAEISDFLQTVEPHSPAPALLKRIATWENKNISEIFKDFGNTPEDWSTLAKFIGAWPTP